MGVKVIRLAIDTGRMDLAAHALVLAAIQMGAGSLESGAAPLPAPISRPQTKKGEGRNQTSNVKNTEK